MTSERLCPEYWKKTHIVTELEQLINCMRFSPVLSELFWLIYANTVQRLFLGPLRNRKPYCMQWLHPVLHVGICYVYHVTCASYMQYCTCKYIDDDNTCIRFNNVCRLFMYIVHVYLNFIDNASRVYVMRSIGNYYEQLT